MSDLVPLSHSTIASSNHDSASSKPAPLPRKKVMLFVFTRFRAIASIVSAFALLSVAPSAYGAEEPLTRRRIAELVEAAPATRVAQFEAAVAGAAATAAGVLSLENPVLSAMGGFRFNPDGSRPFAGQANLSWPVDLGGQRGARVEASKAAHRSAVAMAGNETRRVLLGALLQHQLVLRDEQELAIAKARHALSERFYAAAQQRHTAGSVPELDVVLAGIQEKRDASSEESARGARDADRLLLLSLLGLSADATVEGALVPTDAPPPLSMLVATLEERPDVRAAAASLGAAQAQAESARASRWPTLSLLAQYERDDRANIGLLGLSVPVPILNANRSDVATSAAEVEAARARAEQSRAVAQGQIKELYARYEATQAAMDSLAPTQALATRAVALATRGYELGENDLASVLLVRREAIEAQAELLEVQHGHASVKIELLVTAGRIPE